MCPRILRGSDSHTTRSFSSLLPILNFLKLAERSSFRRQIL
jgi:hypothetical protein